jgi:hypothetical protein
MLEEVGRLSYSSQNGLPDFQSEEREDQLSDRLQPIVNQSLAVAEKERDLSKSVAELHKWRKVAFAGLVVTLAGGGLIIGGLLSSNPWLIAIGVITAIAGVILIYVAKNKFKEVSPGYHENLRILTEMQRERFSTFSREGSQTSIYVENNETVEYLGIAQSPHLSRETSIESIESVDSRASGIADLDVDSPSSTTSSDPSGSSSPVVFQEDPWSPSDNVSLRRRPVGLPKKEQ